MAFKLILLDEDEIIIEGEVWLGKDIKMHLGIEGYDD